MHAIAYLMYGYFCSSSRLITNYRFSGEELGLIESQEISENHATNSTNDWSSTSMEEGLFKMERIRKSTENEALQTPEDNGSDDENNDHSHFALGLVKSNSVVARASMWQQLQQQAKGQFCNFLKQYKYKKWLVSVTRNLIVYLKEYIVSISGTPKPLLRHSRSKVKEGPSMTESFKAQEINTVPQETPLAPSKSTANVLDRDEDGKISI